MGMNDINSLSHSKWNCKYNIVFAPKYRRKVFYKAKRAATAEPIRNGDAINKDRPPGSETEPGDKIMIALCEK